MVADKIYTVIAPLLSDRFWPLALEEGTAYPAGHYQHVANTEAPFVDHNQLIQNWRVQITLYMDKAQGYEALHALRDDAIDALRAMPEFVEQNFDSDGYEPDTKLYTWLLDFSFRDA